MVGADKQVGDRVQHGSDLGYRQSRLALPSREFGTASMTKHATRITLSAVLIASMAGIASATEPDLPVVVNPPKNAANFVPAKDNVADRLAHQDPIGFLKHCLDRYNKSGIKDYTCTFTKRERIGKRLTSAQVTAVKCREAPFSVNMKWVANAKEANRVLYVEGAWTNDDGQPEAWVKPHGWLIKIVVPKIRQPIHGKRAKAAARRSIDQFGFRRSLELILKYTEIGLQNEELKLTCTGEGRINGRPTYVFERYLPYTGESGKYPDALLRFHVDQEWLVLTAVYSYADRHGRKLLGSYLYTDVTFNVGLNNTHFDPDAEGF